MKILFVAGNFDNDGGRPSGLATKIASFMADVELHNGGYYSELEGLLSSTINYDVVFWFANVPNDLPKIRNVKEVAPKVMFVSSKRNDNEKYSFKELTLRAINSKSNLLFEFSKKEGIYNIRVLDPLGCVWYDGTDVELAVTSAMNRLKKLASITRMGTTQTDSNLPLAWYFNSFAYPMISTEKEVSSKPEKEFLDVLTSYSETFYSIMDVPKVDNVPMMPPQAFRCAKGMGSYKSDGIVYVGARIIPGRHVEEDDFIGMFEKNGKLYYSGERKPAVDAPIHMELYKALPNINYIIHSHNYIKGAVMTKESLPCGAIEEAKAILDVIKDKTKSFYVVNELGHGSVLMAGSIDELKAEYYARIMPEIIVQNS